MRRGDPLGDPRLHGHKARSAAMAAPIGAAVAPQLGPMRGDVPRAAMQPVRRWRPGRAPMRGDVPGARLGVVRPRAVRPLPPTAPGRLQARGRERKGFCKEFARHVGSVPRAAPLAGQFFVRARASRRVGFVGINAAVRRGPALLTFAKAGPFAQSSGGLPSGFPFLPRSGSGGTWSRGHVGLWRRRCPGSGVRGLRRARSPRSGHGVAGARGPARRTSRPRVRTPGATPRAGFGPGVRGSRGVNEVTVGTSAMPTGVRPGRPWAQPARCRGRGCRPRAPPARAAVAGAAGGASGCSSLPQAHTRPVGLWEVQCCGPCGSAPQGYGGRGNGQ